MANGGHVDLKTGLFGYGPNPMERAPAGNGFGPLLPGLWEAFEKCLFSLMDLRPSGEGGWASFIIFFYFYRLH